MNEVLQGIRNKYPQYDDVEDDYLTAQIAEKYPAYLKNESFAKDVARVRSGSPLLPKLSPPPGILPQGELDQSGAPAIVEPEPAAIPFIAPEDLERARQPITSGTTSTTYGGPPKPLASLPETMLEPMEMLTQPRIEPPQLKVTEKDSIPMAVGKEAINIGLGIPAFFTSDIGIMSLVAGAAAPVATAGVFTVDLLKNLGQQIMATYKNWSDMTPNQKAVALTDIAGTGIMATLTGKSTVRGLKAKAAGEISEVPAEKPLLPEATKAAEAAIKESEVPNARSFDQTAKVHGNLQSFAGEGEGQVPAEESSAGVQLRSETAPQPNAAVERETEVPVEPMQPAAPAEPVTAEAKAGAVGPSMGGLTPSDPLEPVQGGGNPDIYGIAARVREERAKAGTVAPVPPGEGIAAPDSVEHGRELLRSGASAEESLSNFEKTKKLSADDMALVRAHGEALFAGSRNIEERFGTESPEYNAAWKALSAWDTRSKAMQTEWHKTGMAQQGETDIDTGSFTGLQRAHHEVTGKEFTPDQAEQGQRVAKGIKAATDAEGEAKQKLADQLDKQVGGTNAEKRALDAANKTVREAAVRMAAAETKTRVAKTVQEREAAKIQEDAARKDLEASQKQTREAAARLADAENEARTKLRENPEAVQQQAAQDALDAANKTVTQAAARMAEAENAQRVATTAAEKKTADLQAKAAKKAQDAANKVVREAAARKTALERKLQGDPSLRVWTKAKEYLDSGMDSFDDLRNKIATDLGMPVKEVTRWLARDEKTKFLIDEAWRKQQAARLLKVKAKRWLTNLEIPTYQKALSQIPRRLFGLKVGFHGTVALGTHAPMVAFQPRFWATYVKDFGKMYRMIGNRAYYEMQVQDLIRRPNYITARRAGLVNDPAAYEDFNSPDTAKYFGGLTGMGNRGYSVLKILRQDMFDQHWDQLPKTQKIPEVAEALADGLNHATGVVKAKSPSGSSLLLFAPRLEASRVMWLAGDPAKAVATFADWKNAGPGDKAFAINQVKEKAWVAGTLLSLLALNQGFLKATGSDQQVNLDDPFRNDFLKFKVAGMNFSYGNPMITMARLPVRLYKIRSSSGGKLRNLVYPDEDTYSVLGEYVRSQESPFASLATTLWLKADWQNRPLPSSDRPVPKRLKAQGTQPYTWPEFFTEQVLPIPAEEAMREVWQMGFGMDKFEWEKARKAIAIITVMGATGARLTDDVPPKASGDFYGALETLRTSVARSEQGKPYPEEDLRWAKLFEKVNRTVNKLDDAIQKSKDPKEVSALRADQQALVRDVMASYQAKKK